MRPHATRFVLLDRRTLSISIVLIFTLAVAAPALADYLGPDRVTTEFKNVHVPEKDVWTLTHVDPDDGFADICLIIHPCSEHPSVERQNALCGWTADNSGCTEWWEEQEVTVTYPEATIFADLVNCSPVDGWCTSSPTLNLTGTEPVAGETITLIEGTRNGEVFACEGGSCGVPLLQGQNDFTFWAHSSWGDTSQMSTFSAKVDSEGPSIGIPDAWTIWEPLSIAVDDPRGVELIELTVKGGEYGNRHYQWNQANLPNDWIWDRYFDEIAAPIGEYAVTVEAWDSLGNGSTARGTIVIPPPDEDPEAIVALIAAESESAEEEPAETDSTESTAETSEAETNTELFATQSEPSSAEETSSSAGSEGLDSSGVASASTADDQRPQTLTPPSSGGLLWGAAAAAAITAATAYGLNRKKQREAAIEAKRKEIAARRSARSFADHLQSLRQAAEARIAPIRTAMIAAAAAAAKAAQEIQSRSKVQSSPVPSTPQFEPSGSPAHQVVTWQEPDPQLSATYRLGRIYSSPYLAAEVPRPAMTATPGPPPPGPVPTETPAPPGTYHQPTPAPVPRAPLPPGYVLNDPDLFSLEGKWIATSGRLIGTGSKWYTASAIQYTSLESGLKAVSAPSYRPGTRAEFLGRYGLRGGVYRPSTITRITGGHLIRGVFRKGSLGIGLGTSILGNVWDFSVGSQQDLGLGSREFYVSTGVDFAMAAGVGLASAALVGGTALLVGATLPVTAGIVVTALVGLGISYILDSTGFGTALKQRVNDGIAAWEGVWHNAGTIANVVGERVGATVASAASAVSGAVSSLAEQTGRTARGMASSARTAIVQTTESVGHVANQALRATRRSIETVAQATERIVSQAEEAVADAANSIGNFFGNLFGGGD